MAPSKTDWENEGQMTDYVSFLPDDWIVVFGSNLAGRHGAGAALVAKKVRGAIYGRGVGLQGRCYALPTKDASLATLPLDSISNSIVEYLSLAKITPMQKYFVTRIGCGLAGYRDGDIAPLFYKALNKPGNKIELPNVWFDPAWNKFCLQTISLADAIKMSELEKAQHEV